MSNRASDATADFSMTWFSRSIVRLSVRCLGCCALVLSRLLYRLEVHGREHLFANGPLILTMRHNAGLDSLFVLLTVTGNDFPVGVTPELTVNRFRAWLCRALGMVSLFKEQGLSATSLMKLHKELQRGGRVFIADNEISWDGRLRMPRPGVAWCALHTGAPVVVMVVNGSYRIAPRWAKRLPLRGKLVVRIGKPFYLCDAPRDRVTGEMLERANRRLMEEIQSLSDPKLVNEAHPRCKGIPTLLWQCPVCHRDEALQDEKSWFRPSAVRCRHCETVWLVERFQDDDYHLRVVQGDPTILGQERPLAGWYDVMKAGLRLVPHEDPAVRLEAGEELYVCSQEAWMEAESDNPLFHRWDETDAPREQTRGLGLTLMRRWDRGRLFLTSERFIWMGSRGRVSFRLTRVNSAHVQARRSFGLLYGLRRYRFCFRQDSLLKWLTLTALVGRRIEQLHGHRIGTTNY